MIREPLDIQKLPKEVKRDHYSNKPICGIVATAIATGSLYSEVYDYYAKGRAGSWKGRLSNDRIIKGLRHFGAKLTSCEKELKSIHGKTILHAANVLSLNSPDDVYVIFTRDHVQVVQRFMIADQQGVVWADHYKLKKRKVQMIFRVDNAQELLKRGQNTLTKEDIKMTNEVVKKQTKGSRAEVIIRKKLKEGTPRKDILALLVEEVNTTWASASMMYHKTKRKIKEESAT